MRSSSGRLMTTFPVKYGYLKVHLRYRGRDSVAFVHRLVAEAFIANPHGKPEVNHKDGNPSNPHLDNLEWVTNSENKLHSYRVLGRCKVRAKGERNRHAKLTNEQVIQAREKYEAGGISQTALANEYGISQPQMSCVVRGVCWNHI